jgi:hypothetical protein
MLQLDGRQLFHHGDVLRRLDLKANAGRARSFPSSWSSAALLDSDSQLTARPTTAAVG